MKTPRMKGDDRMLPVLRLVALLAAFLYIVFGPLMRHVLGVEAIIPFTHRIIFAISFAGLTGLSYVSPLLRKHMKLCTYALCCTAVLNILIVRARSDFWAGALVALLLVIPIMNVLLDRWKRIAFTNASFEDIAARIETEERLRESEVRLNAAVEAAKTGIWDWDMIQDKFVFSTQSKAMLGYADDEVENSFSGWKNLWHPDDAPRIEKALDDHLAGITTNYEIIYRCRHKDGDWRWLVTRGTTLRDRANDPYRFIGTNVDITELKRAEEDLKKAKDDYETITNLTGDIIVQVDVDGRWTFLNDTACDFWGDSRETLLGQFFSEYLHPDDQEETLASIHATARSGIMEKHLVNRQRTPKGWRVVQWNGAPIYRDGVYIGFQVSGRDITDQKAAEDAIRRQELEFRTLAENAPDIIARFDESFRHIYVNEAVTREFGLTKEDFIGKTPRELSMPDDAVDAWEAGLHAVFQSGQMQQIEGVYETSQGKRYYQALLTPERLEDGKVQTVVTIIRNVTRQKEVERALLKREAELKEAHHMAQLGRWDLRHEDNRLEWTDTIFAIFEIDRDRFGASYEEFLAAIHPEDQRAVDEAWQTSLVTQEPYGIEHRLLMADGRVKWVHEQCSTVFDALGCPLHSTGIVQDITERKAMEREVFEEKEQFKTTLLSVGDGVISTDAQGKILIMNAIAEQLTGWKQEDAEGKPIEEAFHIINEFTKERCVNPVINVLETGKIMELANHTLLIAKDGSERPIEDSAAPVRDEQGMIRGVVLVFRDFSEKKKQMEEVLYLTDHDHLTGLYNRAFFQAELQRLDTERNLPLTIIMGDVNGLKLINDSFGHAVGDQLLVQAAQTLKKAFRADDIIARMGGDECAILLPRTSQLEAQRLIERTNELLRNERVRDLDVSMSFGLGTKTHAAESVAFIFKKAEDYMYNNKLFEGPSVRGRVIENILATINSKSRREKAHSERVSQLCVAIGEALTLDEQAIKKLRVLGLLHDIGKIAIADDILDKPGALTEREFREMKRHAEIGYRILSTANHMSEMADYVLGHHERWDGTGYPRGLVGDSTPLFARICAVADAYDAMTSDRPYRKGMRAEAAVEEIKACAGSQFDPELADVFVAMARERTWEAQSNSVIDEREGIMQPWTR